MLQSQTTFFKSQSIALTLTEDNAGDVTIADLNNDGFGNFIADTNPVSINTIDYNFNVMAEDIDGDYSRDILVTDLLGSPSYFQRTEISPGTTTCSETILTSSIVNPASLDLKDLDNDTFPDFVLSSTTSGNGNDIVW